MPACLTAGVARLDGKRPIPMCLTDLATESRPPLRSSAEITLFIAPHCETCLYAREVAEAIQREYDHVRVRLVDIETATEAIPEVVFATPTYLLNGRVWSLGNPSAEKIRETLMRYAASQPLPHAQSTGEAGAG